MSYTIDNQTYTDLNLTGRYKTNSVFSLFNHTETKGASVLMEKVFNNPFTEADQINARRDIFVAFGKIDVALPVNQKDIDGVGEYLGSSSSAVSAISMLQTIKSRALGLTVSDKSYEGSVIGIQCVQTFLKKSVDFLSKVKEVLPKGEFADRVGAMVGFISQPKVKSFMAANLDRMSLGSVAENNRLFRNVYLKELKDSVKLLEEIDFYLAVAAIGKKSGYCYANALNQEKMDFEIENMRHPTLPHAVGNNIHMDYDSNLIFLTGANMAGKSTLMKSIGISMYLAHLGFPIAADMMNFTPMEGMFTSINVPDDITQGYSHFYAEVMRVKGVALEVAKKKRLLIIFDELFKGTNVKDAYDGTAAITRAFSRCDKSLFVISTHIMEVGELLKKERPNVQFKYLPTILKNERPSYTYKLTDGIADDRYGMRIINNERIIQIIRGEE